jgi:hypothetical protein
MNYYFKLYKDGRLTKIMIPKETVLDGTILKAGETFPVTYSNGNDISITHDELGEIYLSPSKWKSRDEL